jgi:hypothetical protein
MADKRPRVIGLDELLKLHKSLPEKPAPLVHCIDKEFARLTKDAVELPRRPRGAPLTAVEPWRTGGMVQSKCESPAGQTCFGRWTPAGPGRGAGVYLECVCKGTKEEGGSSRCRLRVSSSCERLEDFSARAVARRACSAVWASGGMPAAPESCSTAAARGCSSPRSGGRRSLISGRPAPKHPGRALGSRP